MTWHLDGKLARLHADGLDAVLDVERPAAGLVDIRSRQGELPGARLLGLNIAGRRGAAGQPAEIYLRGRELVASYAIAAESPLAIDAMSPLAIDAMWRVAPPPTAVAAAVLDLIVSVHAEAGEVPVEVHVETIAGAGQVLRMIDPRTGGWRPVDPPVGGLIALAPSDGPGCLLFRPGDCNLSYVEMVSSADSRHDELLRILAENETSADGGSWRLRHRLFAERLEKGVMLRARVCGAILPRSDDICLAEALCARFSADEPPLGA